MRVLITPGEGEISSSLRGGLSGHSVVLAPTVGIDPESAPSLLADGFEAILVRAFSETAEDETGDPIKALDRVTRGLYDLLIAAEAANVQRCVYLSSLRLMTDYPEHFAVTEGWQPLPPSDNPALLGCHLGELIVREFARERHFEVLILRIGHPIVPGGRSRLDGDLGGAEICTEDVVSLVDAALTVAVTEPCTVVHAQSPLGKGRFSMRRASELLGFPRRSPS